MSTTAPIVFADGGFPDPFTGTPEDFRAAFFMWITSTVVIDGPGGIILGQVGGSQPLTDIGAWLNSDGDGSWYHWDGVSTYVPDSVLIGNSTHFVNLVAPGLGGDRTATFPDKDGIVAFTTDIYVPRPTIALSGTTPVIDWSTTNSFFINITAPTTFTSNLSLPSQVVFIAVTNGGGTTLTWPTEFLFPAPGYVPVVTGQTDLFVLRNIAGTVHVQQLINYT